MKSTDKDKNKKHTDHNKVSDIKPADGKPDKSSAVSAHRSTRRKKKIKKPRIAIIALLILFFAAILAAGILKLNGGSLQSTASGFISYFSSFGGSGYPYSMSDSNIVATEKLATGIMVLDNDSFKILNSSAKELFSIQHNFSSPQTDIRNGRAVLYDRASGRFKVLSRSGLLFEKEMETNILTASIGEKGNLAVATKSLSLQSELTVFDKNKKQIFVWECATERIAAVALSDNGKSAAVAVIGAENAELYSKVLIFNFDENEPVASFNYPAAALIKLKFGTNTVIAAGDKLLSVISLKSLQKQDFSYAAGQLNCLYVQENGKTAVVLSAFGNGMQNDLSVYSSKGELLFEKNFAQEVRKVYCDENYVSVLLNDEVQIFNNKGKQMGSIKTDKYTERVVVAGKKTYLIEKGLITQYSTVGSNK